MKYDEKSFQVAIQPYIPTVVDIEGLEKFLKWNEINKKIKILENKKREIENSPLSLPEIILKVKIEVENERKNFESLKNDMYRELEYIQQRIGGNTFVLLQKLLMCYVLQNDIVDKLFESLVNKENFKVEISQEEREKSLEKINTKISNLMKEQEEYKKPENYKGDYYGFQMEYISRWNYMAPRFFDKCDASGRFLTDERMIKLYDELKLGDLPKVRLRNPIKIGNDFYEVPPSFGSPIWEAKK